MIRAPWLRLMAVLCVFTLVACSPDDDKKTTQDKSGGWIQVPFTVGIDEEKASQEQKDLAKSINEKKGVKFADLTQVILTQHEEAWSEANKNESVDLKAEVLAVMPRDADDIKELKPKYESALKKSSGEDLVYNKDFVTAPSLVKDNRVQCYSGTIFFLSVTRLKGALWALGRNQVVILEPGHVLPGVMDKKDDQWQMTGIETTAGGKALVEYGAAEKLDDVPKPLRVIDANYFLIIEALKSVLTNTDKVMLKALEHTAKTYGVPLKKTEAKVKKLLAEAQADGPKGLAEGDSQKSGEGLEQLMNASPLAFGQANVPNGDQTRVAFDQKPVSEMGGGGIVIYEPDVPDPDSEYRLYSCQNGTVIGDRYIFLELFEQRPMEQLEYLESCLTLGETTKSKDWERRRLEGWSMKPPGRGGRLTIDYTLTDGRLYEATLRFGNNVVESIGCYWPDADKKGVMKAPPKWLGLVPGKCQRLQPQ